MLILLILNNIIIYTIKFETIIFIQTENGDNEDTKYHIDRNMNITSNNDKLAVEIHKQIVIIRRCILQRDLFQRLASFDALFSSTGLVHRVC